MKIHYPILIEKGDTDTAYGIIVPDLPGCFSASDTEAELLDNAREAILLHLETLDNIPQPSSLESVSRDGFITALVDVDLSDLVGESKRINISIPAGLLAMIDKAAKAAGKSRSAYLASAALRAISDT